MSPRASSDPTRRLSLKPAELRFRCDPAQFEFKTTAELGDQPINIIGQPRALQALDLGLRVRREGYNIFVSGQVGGGRSTIVRRMLAALEPVEQAPEDLVFVHNFDDPDAPLRLSFPASDGCRFRDVVHRTIDDLAGDLPQLFESEPYRKRRNAMREDVAANQKALLKKFETRVQQHGFALVQVQVGPTVAPQLRPVITGEPTEMAKLEQLVEQGQFLQEDYDELEKRLNKLKGRLEMMAKNLRNLDRDLQRNLDELDRELARPLVEEALGVILGSFESEGLRSYLQGMAVGLLDRLDEFRDLPHPPDSTGESGPYESDRLADDPRYQVNVVVDNSKTKGRPIIWENAPGYRNLFGTIDAVRSSSGEWATDHMRIKSGGLLKANGGFLILDAMDMLAEAGVWAALKRTLRNREVEIRVFDPLHTMAGVSLKPEPAPIDVKVIVIGTPHIYRLLHGVDEDFKKIFKVKAEFARDTPLRREELRNFACFVQKKVKDEGLPSFHRNAVATVVEHASRLAEDRNRLTTRFTEIADVIHESGFWARRDRARWVRAEHVDRALDRRAYRVDLIEELLRERIADGTVLMDLDGEKIGQVNGLVVLDVGDHAFSHPSRITATTAMGERGIVAIDREAELSGPSHAKGVLILSGFLRGKFAQNKPVTLTASLAFEQNYGPIDGDSASSTELYALISSLARVPLKQGIAVTGSVDQRGEIQPIGGVNEKIEGFFDLCRLTGLDGKQGVMIPRRNLHQLMLRKDLVQAVRGGEFRVWAISTVEEGLEILTGLRAGSPNAEGEYPAKSIYARVDARLSELAELARSHREPGR